MLATKLYFPMGDGDRGLSRAQILKQIDASLQRLRTDYVDLYQCHRYDAATPLEETMEALSEVVRAGKARYIGFSEWTAGQIEAAHALPGVERFVSSQPQYSLLWRLPERAVIPTCKADGISQIVWSPLGQGVLTGKYRAGSAHPPDSRAASEKMGWAMGRFLTDEVIAAVERLRPIAAAVGPLAAAARARLGAPRAERRGGDRRSLAARAARRQRRRVRCAARRRHARDDRRRPRRRRRRPGVAGPRAAAGRSERRRGERSIVGDAQFEEAQHVARREAAPFVLVAAGADALLAALSAWHDWRLYGSSDWWIWLVLALPAAILAIVFLARPRPARASAASTGAR